MKPLDITSAEGAVVADEQRVLGRVKAALSRLNTISTGSPDYDGALVDLRDQIKEAKPEDLGPLVEQMSRVSAIAQRYGRGRSSPVDPASPYFGHLKLSATNDTAPRDILIGKGGLIDREQNVQIVDWRHAPVSRIYYRYDEGDDYQETFGEREVNGVVQARRSVTIRDGRLRRVSSSDHSFVSDEKDAWYHEEGVARAMLSGGQGKAARPPAVRRGKRGSRLGAAQTTRFRADKHLPEIAALIDPKQFELITQPDSGLVVLQGGAGTGKTTVALHRVAYLSYQYPEVYRPEKILIVVPGVAMVHYIERVLPSLGVRGVQLATSQSWFARLRRRIVGTDFTGYNDETPTAVSRFKKHPLMFRLVEEFVHRQVREMHASLEDTVRAQPHADEIMRAWSQREGRPLCVRLKEFRDWLTQATHLPSETRQLLEAKQTKLWQRAIDIRSDWAEMLTHTSLLQEISGSLAPGEFRERDLKEVVDWCTKQSEEVPVPDEDEREEHDRESDEDRDEEDGEDRSPYMSVDGIDERKQSMAGKLDLEDDGLLVALALQKWGEFLTKQGGRAIRFEHVVVDEAQDLSALELRLLIAAAGKRQSVTFAGDPAQRIVLDNGFEDWEKLLAWLAVPVTSNTTLKIGYRSTEEVMTVAQSFVEGDKGIVTFRRGTPVELFQFPDMGQAVAMLAEALRSLEMREPVASVLLITRFPSQARIYTEALTQAEVPAVRWIDQQLFSFRPGIEVVDVAQVKGLEFDYVIILDVNASNYPNTQESRHLLHIAATRAVHQLWLVCTGLPSPLLNHSWLV